MNKIIVGIDEASEMAYVSLNDKCIMEGNWWDFHPNCHGIHEYGEFNSYMELAIAISAKVGGVIQFDYTYRYE